MSRIDFVIPWVDGNDPAWQEKKASYLGEPETDDRIQRYRDWGLLKYWFRGIEKFSPWVRYIWFICDQNPPKWLNKDHPKLKIVKHEDYIPSKYLPVFSANPIELNLHRIDGLSERFVYFNDDMFIIAPINEECFFKKSLPRDCALLNPIPTTDLNKDNSYQRIITVHLNDTEYTNRDYNFRSCIKTHPFKWFNLQYGTSLFRNLMLCAWPRFVGFYEPHLPQPFLKTSYEKAWKQDYDILNETSKHPIRNDLDVNQWLIRHIQLAEGTFIPKKPLKNAVFDLAHQGEKAAETIRNQRLSMICMNDGEMETFVFLQTQMLLQEAFDKILPQKSSFELNTEEIT